MRFGFRRSVPQPKPLVQPHQPMQTEVQPRLPGWRFWLPLLFQTGLIVALPAQDAYTYFAGQQITLQTAPVDPYDLLRGHYQTLSYEISQPDNLRALPGGDWFTAHNNQAGQFYLVLAAPQTSQQTQPPKPWRPVRVSAERPTGLPADQISLRGRTNAYGQISYGIETYYMPEAQRDQLNQAIGQQTDQAAFVVEVKVDSSGHAVPLSLWVKQRNYRF
jgi:uncharacterized membrane-anchored protein